MYRVSKKEVILIENKIDIQNLNQVAEQSKLSLQIKPFTRNYSIPLLGLNQNQITLSINNSQLNTQQQNEVKQKLNKFSQTIQILNNPIQQDQPQMKQISNYPQAVPKLYQRQDILKDFQKVELTKSDLTKKKDVSITISQERPQSSIVQSNQQKQLKQSIKQSNVLTNSNIQQNPLTSKYGSNYRPQTANPKATALSKSQNISSSTKDRNSYKISSKKNKKGKCQEQKKKDRLQQENNEGKEEIEEIPQEIQNRKRFFDIIDDTIINKILLYLQLKDYAKFATLSHQARNKISFIVKQQDFTQPLKQLEYFEYGDLQYTCSDILKINIGYDKLIKQNLQSINDDLKDFNKKIKIGKDILLDILVLAVNFFQKTNKKKNEIIDYILSKGVKSIFKPLSQGYILPSQEKLNFPQFPFKRQKTCLNDLIQLVSQYFEIQQTIKYSKQKQIEGLNIKKKINYYKQFQKLNKSFILMYNRPIYCLQKAHNVFDYLNKNNIQLILPFLIEKEVLYLLIACKKMNELVKIGVRGLLENLYHIRKNLLENIHMSEQQRQLAIYLMHYRVFSAYSGGLIRSYDFESKLYREFILNLGKIVCQNSKQMEQQVIKQRKDSYQIYYTGHSLDNISKDKLYLINEILQKYPDSFVEKGKLGEESKFLKNKIIVLQKYFKGLKLYLELEINKDILPEINEAYIKNIYQMDKKIYHYEKLIKQNEEQLDIFIYDIFKPLITLKTKACPRHLFSDYVW